MKNSIFLPAIALSFACSFTSLSYAAESLATGGVGRGSTLEEFFTAAINYSPQLKIAEENLNISSARKRAANGQLLPQLNANASVSDNRQSTRNQSQTFDGERYSLQLTQVLFNWEAFASRKQASLVENQQEAIYFAELALLR